MSVIVELDLSNDKNQIFLPFYVKSRKRQRFLSF